MKVLIIGPSGSGKTYLSKELRQFGVNSIDADLIDGLSSWYDGKGNKVKFPENAGKEFLDNHHFRWDRAFLIEYLKQHPDIYLLGLSGNVFKMVDLFDRVYFLKLSPQLIEERLQHETRENPMGKTEYQRKEVLDYAKKIEEKATQLGITMIDGSLSPAEIFELMR